jgi:CheY-like chemotaxis protein
MTTSLTASRLDTPKILLVDDNRNGLIVRKALLEEVGFAVQTASNGEEGLDLYTASAFDVVVTDYRMPRMNGTELIQRLRLADANARIIMLSGFVEPLGLTEESTGADIVLAKSSKEAAQLVRAVRRLANAPARRKPPSSQSSPPKRSLRATSR